MATYNLPKVEVDQQFIPAVNPSNPVLAACIVGPQYNLHRYDVAAEKASTVPTEGNQVSPAGVVGAALVDNEYIPNTINRFLWPSRPSSSYVVDQSSVKVYLENVRARYFPCVDLGTESQGTYAFIRSGTYNNRITCNTGTNIIFKTGNGYNRTTETGAGKINFSNRDVQPGDIFEVTDNSSATTYNRVISNVIASNKNNQGFSISSTLLKVNAGSGYTTRPTVTFSAPDNTDGITAAGIAILSISNTVDDILVTNVGSGYYDPPTVSISGGGGTSAHFHAALDFPSNIGVGYITPPVLSGSPASATVSISAPDFPIGEGGVQATATAGSFGNNTCVITITEPGSGYIDTPTVTLTDLSQGSVVTQPTAILDAGLNLTYTYTGTQNAIYTLSIIRTGPYFTGTNSDTCALVRVTSNIGDSTPNDIKPVRGTAFSAGTYGIQGYISVPENLLVAGTSWSIPVAAAGPGKYNILEFTEDLFGQGLLATNAIISASYTRYFAFYLTKPLIEVSRYSDTLNYNTFWTTDETYLYLNKKSGDTNNTASLWVTDPELINYDNTGALAHITVAAGTSTYYNNIIPAGYVYIEYKALVPTNSTEVGVITDITTIESILGPVDPSNPIAQGVYHAKLGAGSDIPVYYVTLASDDVEGYTTALNIISKTDSAYGTNNKIYGVVPMTQNSNITGLFETHVSGDTASGMSHYSQAKWRSTWISRSLTTSEIIVDLKPDGNTYTATVGDDTTVTGTQYKLVTIAGGKLITAGVRAGDSVLLNFRVNQQQDTVYDTYTVAQVRTETTLSLVEELSAAITTPTRVKIQRNYTGNEIAQSWAEATQAANSRRVKYVFPSQFKWLGEAIPSYYMAALLAGIKSAILPHQGMTNMTLTSGIDQTDGVWQTYATLSPEDLDIIAGSGTFIVAQKYINDTPYVRHQLTTAYDEGATYREDSVTSNVDHISYAIHERLKPFIGRYNLNPDTMHLANAELEAELRYRMSGDNSSITAGNQLLGYTVTQFTRDTILRDKATAKIVADVPTPWNTARITFVV